MASIATPLYGGTALKSPGTQAIRGHWGEIWVAHTITNFLGLQLSSSSNTLLIDFQLVGLTCPPDLSPGPSCQIPSGSPQYWPSLPLLPRQHDPKENTKLPDLACLGFMPFHPDLALMAAQKFISSPLESLTNIPFSQDNISHLNHVIPALSHSFPLWWACHLLFRKGSSCATYAQKHPLPSPRHISEPTSTLSSLPPLSKEEASLRLC